MSRVNNSRNKVSNTCFSGPMKEKFLQDLLGNFSNIKQGCFAFFEPVVLVMRVHVTASCGCTSTVLTMFSLSFIVLAMWARFLGFTLMHNALSVVNIMFAIQAKVLTRLSFPTLVRG